MLSTKFLRLFIICVFTCSSLAVIAQNQPEVWLTKADRSVLFAKQTGKLSFTAAKNNLPTINVNNKETYQTIDGFGYALTGGSAQHIIKM